MWIKIEESDHYCLYQISYLKHYTIDINSNNYEFEGLLSYTFGEPGVLDIEMMLAVVVNAGVSQQMTWYAKDGLGMKQGIVCQCNGRCPHSK